MRILRHNQQKSGSHDTVKLTRWGVFDGSQNTGFIKFELGNEARASFLGPFGQKGELKALRHPRCKKSDRERSRINSFLPVSKAKRKTRKERDVSPEKTQKRAKKTKVVQTKVEF